MYSYISFSYLKFVHILYLIQDGIDKLIIRKVLALLAF